MCVVPTVTWTCPPTFMGLWVEVKASSLTGDTPSYDRDQTWLISINKGLFKLFRWFLTSLMPAFVLKGGLSNSSCSLSNCVSRWGCRGEPSRAWQKMAFTGEGLNLGHMHRVRKRLSCLRVTIHQAFLMFFFFLFGVVPVFWVCAEQRRQHHNLIFTGGDLSDGQDLVLCFWVADVQHVGGARLVQL